MNLGFFRVVSSLALAAVAISSAPARGTAPDFSQGPLDPTTGAIDGKVAIAVYPRESGPEGDLLNSAGYKAYLVAQEDPAIELVYPCGTWFAPPRGRYRVWVESQWSMSPYSSSLAYAGRDFAGRGLPAALPVVDAGRVTVSEEDRTDASKELRLLHTGPYLDNGFPRLELTRRAPIDRVGEGLAMPVGSVVGVVWDHQRKAYTALSRPFDVQHRETAEVPFAPPGDGAHLVAQFLRPEVAHTAEDLDSELRLVGSGDPRAPDVTIPTAHAVYAIWYDLAPGTQEIRGGTRHGFLEPQTVNLRSGEVGRLFAELQTRPALDVELALPAPLDSDELSLEIRRLPSGDAIASATMPSGTTTWRFPNLPLERLEVVMSTRFGPFTGRVDLTHGDDGYLLLEPELTTLSGTVFLGDDEHPADLTLTTVARRAVRVATDDFGRYEAVFLEPLRSVSIALEGHDSVSTSTPWVDFFSPPIDGSQVLDFHISDTAYEIRVVDAVTGRSVPRASVLVRNLYSPQRGEDEDAQDDVRNDNAQRQGRTISQQAFTDGEGIAKLPPLRAGEIEIRATATDYIAMSEPVLERVVDGQAQQSWDVILEPVGPRAELRLELPDGAPAAGAEVLLVDSLTSARDLFSERADEDGTVRPPQDLSGVLLARHPGSAFLIRDWRLADERFTDDRQVRWRLPAAAGLPLSLWVTDAWGERPARAAELAIWVGEHRLSGAALAWATGARPTADTDGSWTAINLPPAPLTVLAWEAPAREAAGHGVLDTQAVRIGFPWLDPIEIRAAN